MQSELLKAGRVVMTAAGFTVKGLLNVQYTIIIMTTTTTTMIIIIIITKSAGIGEFNVNKSDNSIRYCVSVPAESNHFGP